MLPSLNFGASGVAAAAGAGSGAGAISGAAAASAAGAASVGAADGSCANPAPGMTKPSASRRGANRMSFIGRAPLQRVFAGFAGADAHRLIQAEDENLAVTDLPGVSGLGDGFERALQQRVVDGDLDLHLRQEVDDVFGAAIQLGVALLATEPLDLRHGDAGHPDL